MMRASAPGMTPKKTLYSQESTLKGPMHLEGFHHIQRTAGRIAASLRQKRRDKIPISQYRNLKDFGNKVALFSPHATPSRILRCFLKTQAIVFSSSVKGSVKVFCRATVT